MKKLTPTELYTDWKYNVSNGDTKLGYDDWVKHNVDIPRGLPSDEEEAEDFAYNYNNGLPLPLIRRNRGRTRTR